MSELSKKQNAFCIEYVKDFNGAQAAIRAGYSKHTARTQASALLTKLDIQKVIQAIINKAAEKVDLTIQGVLKDIAEVKERCLQQKEVTIYNKDTKEHEGTGEYVFDSKGALKALEMQGKYLKMFTDKIDVTGSISGLEKTDIEDLLKGLKEGEK
jgi:phage terminase small subunit